MFNFTLVHKFVQAEGANEEEEEEEPSAAMPIVDEL